MPLTHGQGFLPAAVFHAPRAGSPPVVDLRTGRFAVARARRPNTGAVITSRSRSNVPGELLRPHSGRSAVAANHRREDAVQGGSDTSPVAIRVGDLPATSRRR